ncbi:voltage-dependent calcium channel subunit alpha-2/delta-3-like [Ctenocephalides felis]|uniref:voltage-dependent calcium channel subunit alpha-2/delta-3-like n=1 Tax=Ctenocephalides felis TaxID=7515 RepID=UPI000E6E1432|nr:voltage-dependent calcium channel subunit alpha-2/delta-3-like [Ctenocephalides felis]
MNEIQRKYHDDPLEVVRKDGLILIREMASEVKNMMDFKMSAVKRIMDSAEQAALSSLDQSDNAQAIRSRPKRATNDVSYISTSTSTSSKVQSKYRKEQDHRTRRKRSNDEDGLDDDYYESESSPATSQWQFSEHFDNMKINVTKSEILMANDVARDDPAVQTAIRWSSHLEPLFASNYETDPALSWQYLGTSAGALRRYPASERSSTMDGKGESGIKDYRSTRWYIDAATSPKDVVILLDVTSHKVTQGTSSGATVTAILDSLGDDDFVNVFAYSGDIRPVATCLGGGLVSAHADNKRVILNALNGPKDQWSDLTSKNVNLTKALDFGFDILYRYNRTGAGCQCNQAITLVSSDVQVAPRHVFQKHNWPHMPVRVFAYDVGKDKTTRAEMHWMACSNKGFYARISTPEEAPSKVLDFISVMARPMVMYQNDHPIQWSPVFVAGQNEDGSHRLMTSVSTPVFDRRNHTVRVANLLGVAGTDVPVDQIKKLAPEYKLGVNGYSFIVNNNGHVLYHPGLNPLYLETLKPTYTSVDLTEVELPESENSPRENHSALLDLRRDMIEQKEGETEFGVKTVYDSGRRVATRRHKYFYERVDGTPFSLGVALPEGYGMYELRAELEIRHSSINVTEYFKGNNWRIHPDWVYCEYASSAPAFSEFSNNQPGQDSDLNPGLLGPPEKRLLHFLSRAGRPGWKWMSVRPRAREEPRAAKTDKDGYFCDKSLVQSLVRDAMVTDGLDRRSMGSRQSSHKEDKQ